MIEVPKTTVSGFDFARLRYYSGWFAIIALPLAHILLQFALTTCSASPFLFSGERFHLSHWFNPFHTITYLMMGSEQRSTFQNSSIALDSTGLYLTLTTVARLSFWLGIIATITHVVLRVSFSGDKQSTGNMEIKQCPSCAESIKLEAIKCRFCGHEFDPSSVQIAMTKPATAQEEVEKYRAEAEKLRTELTRRRATTQD